MIELIKKLLKLPKVTLSVNVEPNEYSKDISLSVILEFFIFLFSKKRTKLIMYFKEYDSCKYFVEKYARDRNLGIIKDKLHNDYSQYGVRLVLIKNTSYIELLRYSVRLSTEHQQRDKNKIIDFKNYNSATA